MRACIRRRAVFVQAGAAVRASAVTAVNRLTLDTAVNLHTLRGNYLVEGVAVFIFGPHYEGGLAAPVKTRANAKMRLAFHVAPGLLRSLHARRLLVPLHNVISRFGYRVRVRTTDCVQHRRPDTLAAI